jgi:hypothetical protein
MQMSLNGNPSCGRNHQALARGLSFPENDNGTHLDKGSSSFFPGKCGQSQGENHLPSFDLQSKLQASCLMERESDRRRQCWRRNVSQSCSSIQWKASPHCGVACPFSRPKCIVFLPSLRQLPVLGVPSSFWGPIWHPKPPTRHQGVGVHMCRCLFGPCLC